MITLMHCARAVALTVPDAEIFDRFGENRRAAYAAADRCDAQTMYARSEAKGEKTMDAYRKGDGSC
jgi:hypothetical protein